MKLKSVSLTLPLLMILITGQPARAGLFPSEVETSLVQPPCLEVYAGGVTGPGTGITIQNNCPHPVTINGVDERGYLTTSPSEAIDAYIANAAHPQKYMDEHNRDRNFTLKRAGDTCTGASPYASICQSITLESGDNVLLFVPRRFRITGTPNLQVEGTSTIIRQPVNPDQPFGSMPE